MRPCDRDEIPGGIRMYDIEYRASFACCNSGKALRVLALDVDGANTARTPLTTYSSSTMMTIRMAGSTHTRTFP